MYQFSIFTGKIQRTQFPGASAAGRGAGLDDLRASPAGAGPRAGRRRTGRAGRARGRRAVCQAMSRARSDARPAWVVRVPSRLESADQSVLGGLGAVYCT